MIRNITAGFLIFVELCVLGFESVSASSAVNPLTKFIVTAYYSPLPNQSFYLRGSYEADIILNGRGTHGASGRAVYPGMLAGPKNYAFGTKIYLEGLGVGSIDDRGGAIVGSGSRGYDADRIDIWVGYGEEWLKRALTWWKRTVIGRIIDDVDISEGDMIRLENFAIGKINKSAYLVKNTNTERATAEAPVVDDGFSLPIDRKSATGSIARVQGILRDLGYYSGSVEGAYTKALEKAIYAFQLDNKLVRSEKDLGAGYYGTKTRSAARTAYDHYLVAEKARKEEEVRLALEQKKQTELLAKEKRTVDLFVASLGAPRDREVGVHVRNLQKTLKSLGYFSWKDTAIFGPATKEALVAYQSDRGIEKSELGKLGSSTRIALVQDLMEIRKQERTGEVAYK